MPGPIIVNVFTKGQDEPVATIPMLSAYDAKVQLDAVEQQAKAMDKMVIVNISMADWPEAEDEPEEDKDKA